MATVLSSCYPQEQRTDNYLYMFVIREKDSGILYQSQVELGSPKGLGILLKKRLPHWKVTCDIIDSSIHQSIHSFF